MADRLKQATISTLAGIPRDEPGLETVAEHLAATAGLDLDEGIVSGAMLAERMYAAMRLCEQPRTICAQRCGCVIATMVAAIAVGAEHERMRAAELD